MSQLNLDFKCMPDSLALNQHVIGPTRDQYILDLFLRNYPTVIENIDVIPGISDHSSVV